MVYKNFKTANLAKGHLLAGISAGAVTVTLQTDEGDLFPNVFPNIATIEKYDSTSLLEFKPVLKREIVLVTAKSGDQLTITRSYGYCPAYDGATDQTNTAFSFDAGDSIFLSNSSEIYKDINDELVRLQADKANDDEVVHLDGDETIDGEKTFIESPIIPDGVDPDHAVNKGQLEAAAAVEAIHDKNSYIVGEDVASSDSLFVENMVSFADTVNSTTVDDNGPSLTTNNSTTASRGHRLYAYKPIIVVSVTKNASSAATQATIKNDAGTILATQAFSGNVATFATEVIIPQKTYFRIEADAAGGTYNSYVNASATYPAIGTNVVYVTGSAAGVNTTQAGNLTSIQTIEYTIQKIGDTTDNTRVSIPIFGNGISASTFKLSLKKYVSPGVNLGVRIETDNAGNPSGTLFHANATATVLASGLTTSLVDTTITLGGSITIPQGQKCHIVLFAGTYGAETINSTNFFGVGFKNINTTTRFMKIYNGSVWYSDFIYSATVDDDNITLTTNQATSNARGWKFQAIYDLTLSVITKNSNCTATRCVVKTSGGVTLTTQAFSGNVATLATPQTFSALDYFIIELDNSGASYTSRFLSPATIPQVRTNVIFFEGSENGSSTSTQVFNIDSITTTRFMSISNNIIYATGNGFYSRVLSLTDATYAYKLPVDVPRLAIESALEGESCIATTFGINNNFSGLTTLATYYISNTPGAISLVAGTNVYVLGQTINTTILNVLRKYGIGSIPSLAVSVAAASTTTTSAGFLATFDAEFGFIFDLNVSGASSSTTGTIQYSTDNSTRYTMQTETVAAASSRSYRVIPVISGRYYRTIVSQNVNRTGGTSAISLDMIRPL